MDPGFNWLMQTVESRLVAMTTTLVLKSTVTLMILAIHFKSQQHYHLLESILLYDRKGNTKCCYKQGQRNLHQKRTDGWAVELQLRFHS